MTPILENKLSTIYNQLVDLINNTSKPNAPVRVEKIQLSIQEARELALKNRHHVGSSRRLTSAEKMQIASMLKASVSVDTISRIYGISRQTVYNVRTHDLPLFNRHSSYLAAGAN